MWNDIWAIIWFFFWIFAFTAYLIALLTIVADVFRDSKTSGAEKAMWMIFLVFVPFITAIIYLIARGKGMAERSRRSAEKWDAAYGSSSAADEIAKAKALLDSGAISNDEYLKLKTRALV
jgi:uncharacterized membrane protein